MKKLFSIIALVGAVACVTATAAESATTITTFHSDFTFLDGCTGELVHVTGDLQVITTSTTANNTISGTLHTEFKATGTGLTSGLTYQEVVIFNRAFQTSLQNGEATTTMEGSIYVIAPGGSNNYSSPIFSHTTFDASGNLTSFRVEAPTTSCR